MILTFDKAKFSILLSIGVCSHDINYMLIYSHLLYENIITESKHENIKSVYGLNCWILLTANRTIFVTEFVVNTKWLTFIARTMRVGDKAGSLRSMLQAVKTAISP